MYNEASHLLDLPKICLLVSFLFVKSKKKFWLDPIDQVDFCMHSKSSNGLAYLNSSPIVNNW